MIFALIIDNQHDLDKFNRIYDLHLPYIFRTCYRILQNYQNAEDATQETLITIALNINCITDNLDSLKTKSFLRIIAQRKSLDILRKNKKHATHSISLDRVEFLYTTSELLLDKLIDQMQVEEIIEAIAALPHPYQDVLELYHYHQLNRREISQLMETKYDTVKHQITRGNKLLLKLLKNRGVI